MRKRLLLMCALTLALGSCSDQLEQGQVANEGMTKSSELMPVMSFSSKESLKDFVTHASQSDIALKTRSIAGCFGMMDYVCPEVILDMNPAADVDTLSMVAEEGFTYYEYLGYYKLVPNVAFASTLNALGEVEVNGIIYKITRKGTYYYPESQRESANDIIASLPEGQQVAEGLYQVSGDIMRYDTFHGVLIETSDNVTTRGIELYNPYPDDDEPGGNDTGGEGDDHNSGGPGGAQGTTTTPCAEDSLDVQFAYASNNSGFVNAQYHHNYYSETSRISSRLYDYNYVCYNEVGVSATSQFSPIANYWKSDVAQKLFFSWNNIVLEYDIAELDLSSLNVGGTDLYNEYFRGQDVFLSLAANSQRFGVYYCLSPVDFICQAFIQDVGEVGMDVALSGDGSSQGPTSHPFVFRPTSSASGVEYDSSALDGAALVTHDKLYVFLKGDDKYSMNSQLLSELFSSNYSSDIYYSPTQYSLQGNLSSTGATNINSLVTNTVGNQIPKLINGRTVVVGNNNSDYKGYVIKVNN